jgi:hypothetical protein
MTPTTQGRELMPAIVLSIKIIRYYIPLVSGEGYEKISQE